MKLTLAWLKDHLATTASLDRIADRLTEIGLEVEGIANPAEKLAPFTIARVLEAKPHPNADKLRVAQVEIAKGQAVEVVCGAPNCRTGMIGVFAPLGAFIPGTGITLDKRPVRGVVSNGMLVSERELELSDEHKGIIELAPEMAASIGERYIDALGLGDPVIEIKLTPNRPDCLGIRGIARDLAAAGLGSLQPAKPGYGGDGEFACPVRIELRFDADTADACPVFAGRVIRGVTNGASPAWLQQRLKAVGLRPINALVDVTNFITMDRGRPLHVYDAEKIQGAIHARLGKPGESFAALDGKTYPVADGMTVIADDSGPLGFGGIMGGEATGCSPATRNVLIECAYFDPVRTASTGRRTGIQSDARYRFERGVDPAFVGPGLDLATAMILELCGGVASRRQIAGKAPAPRTVIAFDTRRVEQLTGLALKPAEVKSVLERLGFSLEGKGQRFEVTAPSWRPDIGGAADLVEEAVRIHGIDKVPSTPLPRLTGVAERTLTDGQIRNRRARRTLAARGFVESVAWSFITRREAELFGGGQSELELANPISVDLSNMRPSLLPGLVGAGQRNRDRGFADVALFEVGQAYRGAAETDQFWQAAGVRLGTARPGGAGRHWDGSMAPADALDAKADALATLAVLGFDGGKAQITRDAPAWYHPGRSGTLRLGPKLALATFGELHPAALRALDVAGPVAAFEIDLDRVPAQKRKPTRAKPPLDTLDLQPVRRDFAFILAGDVSAGDVVRAAAAADKKLITQVSVFDLYEAGHLGEGRKSLGIEVTLQPRQATLTEAEIDAVAAKVIAEVNKATGGEIRS